MRTGVPKAYVNIPGKKYYNYHGLIMPCNIQPEPEPLVTYDTKPGGGDIITITLNAIMKGNFNKADFDYPTVHNAVTSGYYGPYLGQSVEDFGGGLYYYNIYRIVIAWDTIVLPLDCTILDAKIMATLTDKWSGFIFSIVIRNGMPDYPHIPVENGDYNFARYTGYGGSAEITDPGDWELVFDDVGKLWINKAGYTKLILMSDRDYVSQVPVLNDTVGFIDDLSYWKLRITYQEAA